MIPLHSSDSLWSWCLTIFPFSHAAVWWKDFSMVLSRSSHYLQLPSTRITCAKKAEGPQSFIILPSMWWQPGKILSRTKWSVVLGVYSCSREGILDPAVATSCYARKFSCLSCLKDWSKGVIYKKIPLDSPLTICHWSRSSWRKGVDYREQTTYPVGGKQDSDVFQLLVTLLHSW